MRSLGRAAWNPALCSGETERPRLRWTRLSGRSIKTAPHAGVQIFFPMLPSPDYFLDRFIRAAKAMRPALLPKGLCCLLRFCRRRQLLPLTATSPYTLARGTSPLVPVTHSGPWSTSKSGFGCLLTQATGLSLCFSVCWRQEMKPVLKQL